MKYNLQNQKAGDGAQQIQAQQIIINQGITEERARSIYAEMIPQAIESYTQDAYATANQRILKLEEIVMKRLAQIEGALEHFSDPAFQVVLRAAQQTAAATEREPDYEMLTGLLIYHIEEGADRIKRAATRKAISIIDLIADEALFALTISNLVVNWIAISPCCHEGLEWKEKVLRKAQYRNLPTNSKWIEHLELLGAVRNIPVSERKSMFDLETEKMNGYVCAGIKKTSSDYEKACALLQYIGFNPDYWLQENELVDGYVRLPISKKSEIKYMDLIPESKIRTFECVPSRKATSREIEVLNSIFQMYSKKKELKIEAEKQFRMQWNQHRFLCEVAQWWDNISAPFDITEAGRIVAHTNAHRLNLIE